MHGDCHSRAEGSKAVSMDMQVLRSDNLKNLLHLKGRTHLHILKGDTVPPPARRDGLQCGPF